MDVEKDDVQGEGEEDESDLSEEEAAEGAELERLKELVGREDGSGAWTYDAHWDLVKALRKAGDLNGLEAARRAMAMKFPLPPEVWLEWAEDQLQVGNRTAALEILGQAAKDYLSVPVLLRHLDVAMHAYSHQELPREKVVELFESAITTAGLELRRGAEIWRKYRSFATQENTDSVLSEKQILGRQLRCPLRGETLDQVLHTD